MKTRDYRDYLQDILDAVNDIENFVDDMTYEQFIKDRKTLNAVVRSIEIIGEASKNIPETLKAKNKGLPWKQMAGMRDKLIHAYFGIDTETLLESGQRKHSALEKIYPKNTKRPRKVIANTKKKSRIAVAVDHCGLTPRLRLEPSSPTLLPAPP